MKELHSILYACKICLDVTMFLFIRMITSVKEISERFFISKFYLSRIFKEATGFTIVEYMTSLKIQQACQMLLNTELTVLEIGLSCGFNSAEHFSKTFKKKMFISPRDFREKRM